MARGKGFMGQKTGRMTQGDLMRAQQVAAQIEQARQAPTPEKISLLLMKQLNELHDSVKAAVNDTEQLVEFMEEDQHGETSEDMDTLATYCGQLEALRKKVARAYARALAIQVRSSDKIETLMKGVDDLAAQVEDAAKKHVPAPEAPASSNVILLPGADK